MGTTKSVESLDGSGPGPGLLRSKASPAFRAETWGPSPKLGLDRSGLVLDPSVRNIDFQGLSGECLNIHELRHYSTHTGDAWVKGILKGQWQCFVQHDFRKTQNALPFSFTASARIWRRASPDLVLTLGCKSDGWTCGPSPKVLIGLYRYFNRSEYNWSSKSVTFVDCDLSTHTTVCGRRYFSRNQRIFEFFFEVTESYEKFISVQLLLSGPATCGTWVSIVAVPQLPLTDCPGELKMSRPSSCIHRVSIELSLFTWKFRLWQLAADVYRFVAIL